MLKENISNTVLVFGINSSILAYIKSIYPMSTELIEFSEMIDEQFEPGETEIESDDFWEAVVNLFI